MLLEEIIYSILTIKKDGHYVYSAEMLREHFDLSHVNTVYAARHGGKLVEKYDKIFSYEQMLKFMPKIHEKQGHVFHGTKKDTIDFLMKNLNEYGKYFVTVGE